MRDVRNLFCCPLLMAQAPILCAGAAHGLPFPPFALRRGQGRPRKRVQRRAQAHRRECVPWVKHYATTCPAVLPATNCLQLQVHLFHVSDTRHLDPTVASVVTVGMLSIPSQPLPDARGTRSHPNSNPAHFVRKGGIATDMLAIPLRSHVQVMLAPKGSGIDMCYQILRAIVRQTSPNTGTCCELATTPFRTLQLAHPQTPEHKLAIWHVAFRR